MPHEEVIFSNHATSRLFERGLNRSDVERVLRDGEVIRQYPDDTPYPSYLMLGWTEDNRPIHVVAADDNTYRETHVITTYEPDPDRWADDFRTRLDESND